VLLWEYHFISCCKSGICFTYFVLFKTFSWKNETCSHYYINKSPAKQYESTSTMESLYKTLIVSKPETWKIIRTLLVMLTSAVGTKLFLVLNMWPWHLTHDLVNQRASIQNLAVLALMIYPALRPQSFLDLDLCPIALIACPIFQSHDLKIQ